MFLVVVLLLQILFGMTTITPVHGESERAIDPQSGEVTAYDLIIAMNTLRISYGLPALIEDPIIDAVAAGTAQIMADGQLSWHIGNVGGRIQSAGYGGGAKVFATENFAMGGGLSIDEIMVMWSDESHMIPAVKSAYCHVGAGTAKSANGYTYYVLQAAYVSGQPCGSYTSSTGTTNTQTGTTQQGNPGAPGMIIPVAIATPGPDGTIIHEVKPGQSFWAIAVAYKTTIKEIEQWNNISQAQSLPVGKKLVIPNPKMEGYATPTPVGMIVPAEPDANGKIVHKVAVYNNLSRISDAYKVPVATILKLNAWNEDWPLQIGQELLIDPGNVTPTVTPRPLTAIEKLTPAADGKYYHEVAANQTISGIAGIYNVNYLDLLKWNYLTELSVILPGQKLLLQVTPPATATYTLAPTTPTKIPTATMIVPTATRQITPTPSVTPTPEPEIRAGGETFFWIFLAVIVLGGGGLILYSRARSKREAAKIDSENIDDSIDNMEE